MDTASFLLFEKTIGNSILFKNQQELVITLLNDRNGPYYIDSKDIENFAKAQSRLKTYVSQLLSPTSVRNVTEDFKKGLTTAIEKKINDYEEAISIVKSVIADLKEKNVVIHKQEPKKIILDQFTNDIIHGSYVAIITSKPLEIESDTNEDDFSLKKIIFQDILQCLITPNKDCKNYRFNFPLESSGMLFWKGLKKLLTKYLKLNINDTSLFDVLYLKFVIKTSTHTDLIERNNTSEDYLKSIVDEILILLNRNRNIMVFIGTAPIYTIPTIAVDPADFKNMKLYALLGDKDPNVNIYKYSSEDIILWRLFVWDKLKTMEYAGKDFPYDKSFYK